MKTNSTATGPKLRSAQLHSGTWPTPTAPARPVCTARVAHVLSGRPRSAWPVTTRCGARAHTGAVTALRARVATVTEVEQTMALEHPRRRGYPPGMGVEAIAHRSSLSTGRGKKTGSVAAFSDEARASVAGGGPASGWREREVGSTLHGRKSCKRGLGLRSPWTSSRRRRRPDNDGGTLE
jgi:hypothetical protein